MAEIPDDTVSYILKYSDEYNDIDELRAHLMELQKEDNNIVEKILETIRKAEEEEEERRRRSATGKGRWVGEEDTDHESFIQTKPSREERGIIAPSGGPLPDSHIVNYSGSNMVDGGKRRKPKRRKPKGRKTKGRKTKGKKN